MLTAIRSIVCLSIVILSVSGIACQTDKSNPEDQESALIINHFYNLFREDPAQSDAAVAYIESTWKDEYIPMLLDVAYVTNSRSITKQALKILKEKTGKKYHNNISKWHEWIWSKDEKIISLHGDWMSLIYQNIDPKFDKYFRGRTKETLIRLDEVRWGGVLQDGIPPLRAPKMLSVEEADYLGDDNVVFGIEINGDARAYPKRILAWHEMFVDEIGGEKVAGVYCTLCGTVIAYNTQHEGKNYDLGTSGFLYRSNKLMYDKATQSLWNTIEGKPVIGRLIDQGIELSSFSVVTTTWKAWKELHPDTKVLSLDTGHRRDYGEGRAYNQYFSTDNLMFNVPKSDNRLKNKDEVLIIRAEGYQDDPLAISAGFLKKNKVYHDQIGDTKFVVLTDKSGANRVYASQGHEFSKIKGDLVVDKANNNWKISEEYLTKEDGTKLERLPYHRIFWFAWYNTYLDTRLVK